MDRPCHCGGPRRYLSLLRPLPVRRLFYRAGYHRHRRTDHAGDRGDRSSADRSGNLHGLSARRGRRVFHHRRFDHQRDPHPAHRQLSVLLPAGLRHHRHLVRRLRRPAGPLPVHQLEVPVREVDEGEDLRRK